MMALNQQPTHILNFDQINAGQQQQAQLKDQKLEGTLKANNSKVNSATRSKAAHNTTNTPSKNSKKLLSNSQSR